MEAEQINEYDQILKDANQFLERKCIGDALTCYKRLLKLNPISVEALSKLANVYQEMGKIEKAVKCYERIIELNEDDTPLQFRASLLDLEKKYIFWDNLARDFEYFKSEDVLESGVVAPFLLLSNPLSNKQLLQASSAYVAKMPFFNVKPLRFSFQDRKHGQAKIRIGFLCGDFRTHPTGYVIGEFFELIDRQKFDVYLYDIHPEPASDPSKRIYKTTDHVTALDKLSDEAAAQKIYDDKIDVLVDLNGLTAYHRLGIFTYQPAVAQGTFLGYLGTLGGIPGCDFNFADQYAVPPNQQQYYAEQLKYLYPVHRLVDRKVDIAPNTIYRPHLNFGKDTIVLCCFNNSYKFTPNYFDLWARILKRVPNAILWFYRTSDTEEKNIVKEFQKREIDASKLSFCNMVPHQEHLLRYQVADLLLDTEYYNAHTTAMEALYMGCPMITCPGDTFTSRAGGAILTALGMPDMICKDIQEYEEKVVSLCTTPGALSELRNRTQELSRTSDLFNTEKFTRSFEKNCVEMFNENLKKLKGE